MRTLNPSIGQAVGERTYLRPVGVGDSPFPNPVFMNPKSKHLQHWFQIVTNSGSEVVFDDRVMAWDDAPVRGVDFRYEEWWELATRVAYGNSRIDVTHGDDYLELRSGIENGHILMAGRHLQHGDASQPTRPQSVFTNCSTAASAWSRFYLLLNGSGVGRSLDDDLLLIDWDLAPHVQCVLDEQHQDFRWGGEFMSVQESKRRFGLGERVHWHEVEDSREGWARALETWEMMAFERRFANDLLILDYTQVRPEFAPIKGMQGRPSSGPRPTMAAFHKAAAGRGSGLPRWKATAYVEHYFSESVMVGGARRASGLLEKFWKDPGILDFIMSKVPVEYIGLTADEIKAHRETYGKPMTTPLWTSNHSIGVDAEFWWLLSLKRGEQGFSTASARHARAVFKLAIETAWATGSGEPGFLNLHKLNVSPKIPENY